MFYTILVVTNLACLALIGVLTGPAILHVLGVN
jgi:hypothetical protein